MCDSWLMIFSQKDLPAVGTAQESLKLDFKATLKPKPTPNGDKWNHFEMAKDVAALANAYGGTILIGANEDRAKGTLAAYVPIPEPDANQIKVEIQKAVSQRCVPVPVHEVLSFQGPVGFVVSVNVWAFPDQAVGVKIAGDLADGFGDPAFVFPLRTATNTIMLLPTQLPLLIHAPSRRIAVLLEGINSNERSGLRVICVSGTAVYEHMRLELVDTMSNVALLKGHKTTSSIGARKVALPLDAITSVWKDANGRWTITVNGMLAIEDEERTHFMPRF